MATADAQGVCDAVDVVEPRGDQGDLQDGLVVEAGGAELVVIAGANARGVLGQLNDVIAHDALGGGKGSGLVVLAGSLDQRFIECDATQKLCVGFNSIPAPIRDGDHGCDHFVLAALQRQVG